MKKTLLISISLVVCSLLFAATYSTTAKNSFDLYHNTLDKAFYPNEEFTSLDKTYLFMSGEDLEFNLTDSSSGTFVGGVYTKIADRPYSLFIKSSVENNYGYGGKSYEETPVQG